VGDDGSGVTMHSTPPGRSSAAQRSIPSTVSEWFREELGEKAQREIRGSALRERGLIDYDHVDELWAAHRGGQEWSFQLWNLYNVSAWYDHWVAGRELVA
jgi:asparagine synthetase B (glutamine-hydrolysing)